MENVPRYLFSMPLVLSPDALDDVSAKIPRHYSDEFNLRAAELGEGREFLAAVAVGRPTVLSSKSLVRAVAKADPRRVAICSPYLDHGMMRALASEGIAYIKDEGNVFLPFLGMAASPVPEGRAARPLSPHAQRMALNLIAGRWNGLAAGELAKAASVSRSTVTNCLAEIEAILPSALSTEWKRRVLRNPGMSKDGMLEAFEPYLVSPVKGRKLLKGRGALAALRRFGALLSGESALPYYSDLAHDVGVVRVALYRKSLTGAQEEAGDDWVEAEWFEAPDVIVEEWAYELDGSNNTSVPATGLATLDALGLYAEMKDAGEDDVRLADAVAQLREAVMPLAEEKPRELEVSTRLCKWGSSHAVRIPKRMCESVGIGVGSALEMHAGSDSRGGFIVIRPSGEHRSYGDAPYVSMDELFSEHVGPFQPAEFDWGRDVGAEVVE
ncbi:MULTISPECIES: hypothetical protein [unclassified Adlercreutzia]|uniref:AbrB/MazE/SpoVT family DNA-binding domain-containing protein n=1 Tax=unclassified Adlercreutzia TaxID=2636013 RepID=UPI0013ECDD93|nr:MULTISPECIES: hypothetical protein [unclassified Adlercreutzia]